MCPPCSWLKIMHPSELQPQNATLHELLSLHGGTHKLPRTKHISSPQQTLSKIRYDVREICNKGKYLIENSSIVFIREDYCHVKSNLRQSSDVCFYL